MEMGCLLISFKQKKAFLVNTDGSCSGALPLPPVPSGRDHLPPERLKATGTRSPRRPYREVSSIERRGLIQGVSGQISSPSAERCLSVAQLNGKSFNVQRELHVIPDCACPTPWLWALHPP